MPNKLLWKPHEAYRAQCTVNVRQVNLGITWRKGWSSNNKSYFVLVIFKQEGDKCANPI